MRHQPFVLIGGNFQFQRVVFAPHSQVALDASLGVQHQVPCAAIRGQIVHHVGDHAAQPAEAVFSAHGHAPLPAQIVAGRARHQRLYFHGWRVQLPWGQCAAINGKFVRLGCGFQQRCKRSHWDRCGEGCFGHGGTFLRGARTFLSVVSRPTAS